MKVKNKIVIFNMEKLLVKNLDVFYGDKKAINNIDLTIKEKQVTSLIGPSGCGKSTFLRCLNRMNDTVEGCKVNGDIILDGVDIYKDNVDVVGTRGRVGMVFQKPNPFPKSIYDNVAMAQEFMAWLKIKMS